MNYLTPSYYFDYEDEIIQELIKEFQSDKLSLKEKAIGIYLKIRDGWRYNPYHLSLLKSNYKASFIAKKPDGESDSIFHEFDKSGNKFMEYLKDYGYFEDIPVDFILDNFKENYPEIMKRNKGLTEIKI